MKLIEAYDILRKIPAGREAFSVFLTCGFNPLHFQTMLAAQVSLICPNRQAQVKTGLYGDFLGNLQRLKTTSRDVGILLLEWPDLDPRLGIRSLGGWNPADFGNILENVRARCNCINEVIQNASQDAPLLVCLPTLPLPPISFTNGWQASSFDLELKACVSALGAQVAQDPRVRIVSQQRLDRLSPPDQRFDAQSEILAGFPFKLTHAAALAEIMGHLILAPSPKKGLITDLDDTLWKGVLGEVGVEGISWGPDNGGHRHGIYQQFLHALSVTGVLIGISSKNDRSLVEKAFRRDDLILPLASMYPFEIHWAPKSESVARILKAWNIGADSVVFVDDSPMELADVKASHPDIECVQFPRDNGVIIDFLERLRDLFGKTLILEEDTIRLTTIVQAPSFTEKLDGHAAAEFLERAEAELTLNFSKDELDPRVLELVNKANQFNLNGKRHSETDWYNYLKKPDTFQMVVGYGDKYGPLGKVAVLAGRRNVDKIFLDVWVMSCRAFSRRIEHRCLQELLTKFGLDEILLDYIPTERNEPFRLFLAEILDGPPTPGCCISKHRLLTHQPTIFHRVRELLSHEKINRETILQ